MPDVKIDMMFPVGNVGDKSIFARIQVDSPEAPPRVSIGELNPIQTDSAISEDVLRLHRTDGSAYRVEVVTEGLRSQMRRKGPPVGSRAYCAGWDRIFGQSPKNEMVN